MSHPSVSVLLVSDQAEDVKQMTTALREAYPGGRIEAVYTATQALEWVSHHAWGSIIVDFELPDVSGFSLIQKLRHLAPQSSLILQSRQLNISPLQAMRSGATALLLRETASFLTDLLAVLRTCLDSGEEPPGSDLLRDQSLQSVEARGGLVYELDAIGRFTYISASVRRWLGYEPGELLGTHYACLLDSESKHMAAKRFDERRAGARATRQFGLRLLPKPRVGPLPNLLPATVSARGLYASPDLFLGTVGVIHEESAPPSPPSGVPTAPADRRTASEGGTSIEPVWYAIQHFLGQRAPASSKLIPLQPRPATPQAPPMEAAPKPEPDALETAVAIPRPVTKEFAPSSAGLLAAPYEQRGASRRSVLLPSDVSCAGETWSGSTTNLGKGGLCIDLGSLPMVLHSHPVHISLVSDVLFLQLSGSATTEHAATGTRMRVHFGEMDDVKRTVLLSFLEILKDHPDRLRVQIQVPSLRPLRPTSPAIQDEGTPLHPSLDRRLDARVACQLSIHVRCRSRYGVETKLTASLLDFHMHGAHVRTPNALPLHPAGCWIELPPELATPRRPLAPLTTDTPPTALLPIAIVRESQHEQDRSTVGHWHYGIRFGALDEPAESRLAALVNHAVLTLMASPAHRAIRSVVTELLFTHNVHDQRISMYHDHVGSDTPGLAPLVVISPDIGRTKEDYLRVSYFLAAQGLHVLRYDPTNHIGESDGHTNAPLLSRMQADLSAVLAFADEFWPGTPLLLIGDGMGGRLCARALNSDWWIVGIALLDVPLEISEDLHRLQHLGRDPFATGHPRSATGYFRGARIATESFIQDALMSRYVSVQDLAQDFSGTTVPAALLTAQDSLRTPPDLVDRWRSLLAPTVPTVITLPPRRLPGTEPHSWAHQLAQFCLAQARHGPRPSEIVPIPEQDLHQEEHLERLRMTCLHRWTRANRQRHWSSLAHRGHVLFHSIAYRPILASVAHSLASLSNTHRVLELGCGYGELAAFLLTYRPAPTDTRDSLASPLPEYIGLDFDAETLAGARLRLLTLQSSLSREGPQRLFGGRSLTPCFAQGEMDEPLPFHNSRFDAVIVNLALGHLADPLGTLRECWRVLAPGGRLVLLVPSGAGDLAQWYRTARDTRVIAPILEPETEHIEDVLAECERGWAEGGLRRFSPQDLTVLLASLRASRPTVDAILDEQLLLATAQKP